MLDCHERCLTTCFLASQKSNGLWEFSHSLHVSCHFFFCSCVAWHDCTVKQRGWRSALSSSFWYFSCADVKPLVSLDCPGVSHRHEKCFRTMNCLGHAVKACLPFSLYLSSHTSGESHSWQSTSPLYPTILPKP